MSGSGYLQEEVLGDPPVHDKRMQIVDNILVRLLRRSNQHIRDELYKFLKRWELRVLFVDALQEEKQANQ